LAWFRKGISAIQSSYDSGSAGDSAHVSAIDYRSRSGFLDPDRDFRGATCREAGRHYALSAPPTLDIWANAHLIVMKVLQAPPRLARPR
jgi:hypothetical protein